jgi:hypothetical protein
LGRSGPRLEAARSDGPPLAGETRKARIKPPKKLTTEYTEKLTTEYTEKRITEYTEKRITEYTEKRTPSTLRKKNRENSVISVDSSVISVVKKLIPQNL